jgi:hypothetical protein
MLSVAEDEMDAAAANKVQEHLRSLIYVPPLHVEKLLHSTLVSTSYAMHRTRQWLAGLTPPPPQLPPLERPGSDADTLCKNCIEYNETRSIVLIDDWDFTYFPFDRHVVDLAFSLHGPRLFGCDQLVKTMRDSAGEGLVNILPLDDSWLGPDGELVTHSQEGSTCKIHINVRRNFLLLCQEHPGARDGC